MTIAQSVGRSAALAAFAAAAAMVGLIVSLASAGPAVPPDVLDALSIGTAATGLIVVVLAYAPLAGAAWAQAGRALSVAGLTLVLAGDAFQSVALRGSADAGVLWSISFAIRDDIGNSLFFIGLIVLGALVWSSQRAVGGLAIASGMLGFLDLAFAARLGLPPHLSFLALVLWFVVLGVSWWRAANGAHEGRRAETVGQANLPA